VILPGILLGAVGVFLVLGANGSDGAVAGGALLVVVGVLMVIVGGLINGALRGIFGVALYRFAADGQATGGFTEAEMQSVVRQRRGI
jgi:hypothetical protein